MSKAITVALAGAGAFGIKHLDALELIHDPLGGVEVVSLIGRERPKTKEVADNKRHRPRHHRPGGERPVGHGCAVPNPGGLARKWTR